MGHQSLFQSYYTTSRIQNDVIMTVYNRRLTFRSWMTMFMRRSICLSEALPSKRSAIETLFLIARYSACWRPESGHGMVTCRSVSALRWVF